MKQIVLIAALLITTALPIATIASAAPQSPDRYVGHCASGDSDLTSAYPAWALCR